MSEVTIYDRNGEPTAYIDNDGETIVLWDGRSVAYFAGDDIYAWDGAHLGTFRDGILYDASGMRVGFLPGRCPSAQRLATIKMIKQIRMVKGVRQIAPIAPVKSIAPSNIPLNQFLTGERR